MNQQTLLQLAKDYGTPLYVYDGDQIEKNFNTFRDAFGVEHLSIHYACKALPNISILKLIRHIGGKLDTVSVEEIKLGLTAGFDPQEIIFTPSGVGISEYDEAIKLGVSITIDNLSILEKIGLRYPNQALSIRINPHLMAGGNQKISVGHVDSKFGISIHQIPILKRIVNKLNLNITGFHVHTGSDIGDSAVFMTVLDLLFDLIDDFKDVKSLDLGGGFKVKYRADDHATDVIKMGKSFSKVFNAYCKEKNRTVELRFEPGKYLVSNAGYFLTQVNIVKQTTACTFVAVNSGFNHFIRPMFYDAYHEIDNLNHPDGEKKLYSVVGNICETDTFAEDRLLPEIREKDILVFKNAGAYAHSMASNYNSRVRPAEVLTYKDKTYLIRKQESFDDLLTNQIIVDSFNEQ